MRKGRIGIVFAVVLLVFGCVNKKSVPSDILPAEKMKRILWDLIQADQYAAMYVTKDSAHSNVKMESLRLYEQVFQMHKVSREEFRKSYQFYQDHPELNQIVFDSLLVVANRERSAMYSRPNAFKPPTPAPTSIVPGNGPRPGLPGAARFPMPDTALGRPPFGPHAFPKGMPDSVRRRLFRQGIQPVRNIQPPPSGKPPVP